MGDSPVSGRVVGLVRVSDPNQPGDSQHLILRQFAERESIEYQRIVWEQGRPRGDGRNSRDFEALIEDGENGLYDWLVVDSKIRLGTGDSDESGYYATRLRRGGVRIWSVAQGELTRKDAATSINNTLDSIQSQGEVEVEELARKVSRGMRENALNGNTNTGLPPYGYDRIAVSPSGEILYRVVTLSPLKKEFHYPNGTILTREGKGVVAGKSRKDRYRLVPSLLQERQDIAKEIFKRFTQESITPHALALDINQRGIRNPNSKTGLWDHKTITSILENPTYHGLRYTNRTSRSKYFRMDASGAYAPGVRNTLGRAKSLKLDRQHWVAPKTQDASIVLVSAEVWESAQERLATIKQKKKRPPRSDSLWLAPFLRCAGCGERMRGWSPSSRPGHRSYHCSTYDEIKIGRRTSGCELNRIHAVTIEAALPEFCRQYGLELEQTEESRDRQFKQEFARWLQASAAAANLHKDINIFLKFSPFGEHFDNPFEVPIERAKAAYRVAYEEMAREVSAEISAAQELLAKLLASRLGLKLGGAADRLTLTQIAEQEKRIESLESRLVPLDEQLDRVFARAEQIREDIERTRKSLAGKANRVKADLLGRVLETITVHFGPNDTPDPHKRGRRFNQIPTRLVFTPIQGKPLEIVL